MLVEYEEEQKLIADVLVARGVLPERAHVQASWLVEGDLRGHRSHGIQRLPVIVGRIENGCTRANASPYLEWVSRAALVVDGKRGLGPCVAVATVGALLERSLEQGVAVAAIHNANHLGLLAPYVEQMASAGLVGIAMTTSEALVHPWGGRVAMIGTNPIAVGIPAEPEPFILDMATGATSMGKILHHRLEGVPLDPGWAIDEQGDPTSDAQAASAISPFGGAKGYGLGLALELLVAALTGTALGREVTGTLDTDTVCNKGDVLICLNPTVFGSARWIEAISRFLTELRNSPAQPGTKGVAVPGDRTRSSRSAGLARRIEIPDAIWARALALLPDST